jgi:hypothetical protein
MAIIVSIILGTMALIGWLSHLRFKRYQFNIKYRNERFNRVIDRFGEEKDFREFLQSEKGLQIMSALTLSPASTKVPILVMISSGVIALAIGLGAMALTFLKDDDLIFPTAFMSALGLGLLIAAAISYRLSRQWGIFEENNLIGRMSASGLQRHESTEKH